MPDRINRQKSVAMMEVKLVVLDWVISQGDLVFVMWPVDFRAHYLSKGQILLFSALHLTSAPTAYTHSQTLEEGSRT